MKYQTENYTNKFLLLLLLLLLLTKKHVENDYEIIFIENQYIEKARTAKYSFNLLTSFFIRTHFL